MASIASPRSARLFISIFFRTPFSSSVPELETLGLSERDLTSLQLSLDKPYGNIIVGGPTGSGKTTTVYSILEYLKRKDDTQKMCTVEYGPLHRIEGVSQINIDSYSPDTERLLTADKALKTILRNDPDVIMCGEIRDKETARTVIDAGLSGHKVISELHITKTVGAIQRLNRLDVRNYLIGNSVNACMAQQLVRELCPVCKYPVPFGEDLFDLDNLTARAYKLISGHPRTGDIVYIQNSQGCKECSYTGIRKRIPIFEILVIEKEFKVALEKGELEMKELNSLFRESYHNTMFENALDKAFEGKISCEEATLLV